MIKTAVMDGNHVFSGYMGIADALVSKGGLVRNRYGHEGEGQHINMGVQQINACLLVNTKINTTLEIQAF